MSYDFTMLILCCTILFFFFKQKTAYEMRISDWSSDVCSSDLFVRLREIPVGRELHLVQQGFPVDSRPVRLVDVGPLSLDKVPVLLRLVEEIGRASCRERVCQYV